MERPRDRSGLGGDRAGGGVHDVRTFQRAVLVRGHGAGGFLGSDGSRAQEVRGGLISLAVGPFREHAELEDRGGEVLDQAEQAGLVGLGVLVPRLEVVDRDVRTLHQVSVHGLDLGVDLDGASVRQGRVGHTVDVQVGPDGRFILGPGDTGEADQQEGDDDVDVEELHEGPFQICPVGP